MEERNFVNIQTEIMMTPSQTVFALHLFLRKLLINLETSPTMDANSQNRLYLYFIHHY